MTWPPVPLSARLSELVRCRLAVTGRGPDGAETLAYVQVNRRLASRRLLVTISDTATRTPLPSIVSVTVPADLTLAEVLLSHADIAARVAALVPGLRWPMGANPALRDLWWIGLVIPVVFALAAQSLVPLLLVFLTGILPLALGARRRVTRSGVQIPATAVDEAGRELLPSRVRPLLPDAEALASAGPTPSDRVGLVRDRLADLRDDIVYRIGNSALFDPAHPATERLELALLAWAPGSPTAEELATEVEDAFEAARRSAEELGFDHLPQTARPTARRAQSAARTALSAGTREERTAAAAKAAELLSSLALYYLPGIDADAPGLIAPRRMIEPR